jgi:magnesium chelatase family protein
MSWAYRRGRTTCILRVARAVANLEGSEPIKAAHIVEAISYCSLDRKLWMR